ncbi:MAG: xanthine dehydrogenase family protein molybdopterin-binding subunit, partial [Pseudomonadales bacterium]
FDRDSALAIAGVLDVVEIASGIAVVAEKYWTAKKGAAALQVEWHLPELAAYSSAQIKADYKAALAEEGSVTADEGDLDAGFANATHVVESQYWAPYLAHAPMEPMNAIVRIENGEADVWTGSQGTPVPQGLVARYAGLDKDKVRSHNTYLGGAFGRRATLTHVIEATQVAVATNKPIQVVWSREDDIQSGIYRPASLMQIKAGVDDQGKISAWDATRVGGNITPETLANMMPGFLPTAVGEGVIDWMVGVADSTLSGWVVDTSSVEGLYEDYDLSNRAVRHVTKDHGLPLTFWRSVGHSYTAFAKEALIDELAEAAGMDPVAFRLNNTKDKPRLHNVIKVAGEHMQRMQPAPGRSLGFAAHSSFSTDVAEVAEVSVDNGVIKVHKVLCVVDCGVAVNPDIVRAQMEGAVMYGLTAALHGNLELENGAIKESNFHDYPILRMNEAPEVEVVIIDSAADPTGVGEPGLPPIAPAVANAVYAATGQRLRSLPLRVGSA